MKYGPPHLTTRNFEDELEMLEQSQIQTNTPGHSGANDSTRRAIELDNFPDFGDDQSR